MKITGVKSPIQVQKPQGLAELIPMIQEFLAKYPDFVKKHEEMTKLHAGIHEKIQSVAKGPQGVQGVEGRPGRDGVSPEIDYERIIKGVTSYIPKPKDGKDGKDGSAPTAEEIIGMLFSPDRLELQKLVEMRLDPHVQNLRRLVMRGGGDTVAAGTGVTITQSNGVKTISASGVSTLTSTETPNGSRTAFTFASATAQPSYIVADNVWYRATTKSGTVNWTWNSGTKQATLTIPPTDEIFAIV